MAEEHVKIKATRQFKNKIDAAYGWFLTQRLRDSKARRNEKLCASVLDQPRKEPRHYALAQCHTPSEEYLGKRKHALLPRHAMRDARLVLELVEMRHIPVVVPN